MTPSEPSTAPYGSWSSPVTAHLLAEAGIALGGLQALAGSIFWLELRPLEGGRYVLVRSGPDGGIADITPSGYNARTLVHEYGGGSFALRHGGGTTNVVFSNFDDQRLYRQDISKDGSITPPLPLTSSPESSRALRYADGRFTPDGRSLICVRERHESEEVVNELVAVTTTPSGADQLVLASEHDFYAAPRVSPDGRALAWLSWDHPQMPWDGTELWVGELSDRGLLGARRVAGGPKESIVQPAWSPDGRLHFVSDCSGWWNLYRADDLNAPSQEDMSAISLAPLDAEFARPTWVFGLQSYAFLPDGRIVCFYSSEGVDHVALVDPENPGVTTVPCAFTTLSHLAVSGGKVAVIGGSATESPAVAVLDTATGGLDHVRRSRDLAVGAEYLSRPESISFPTSYDAGTVAGPLARELESAGGKVLAHALYYGPANPDFRGSSGERPPLIVMSHGGPTSAREAILSLDVQFWTSRGVAVVDVNYGGSTGYGRAYRERLRGNWGVVDTVDCINAARYLVARGDVDPARIAVQGGSAGGYTTLNALTRHRFFSAGASFFGLADLELFAAGGTHKFESQYLSGLIGPFPERADLYRERSPINHVDDICCPVILLQGLDDAIVPPAQADVIVTALRSAGLPFAYVAFAGEQHGFRKAENIIRSEEAVLAFYGRIFGFAPADQLEPLPIENLG